MCYDNINAATTIQLSLGISLTELQVQLVFGFKQDSIERVERIERLENWMNSKIESKEKIEKDLWFDKK